jgi:sporulation protein YlmC with PRC-barrel domain
MSAREAHVELLLGRPVVDADGRKLGRLEEIRAVAHGGQLYVSQYLVGRYGLAARLTSASLLPRVLHLVGVGRRRSGYLVPWTWMDLSDPAHPRVTRPLRDLPGIEDEKTPYRAVDDE